MSYPILTQNMKATLVKCVNQVQYEDYIVHYHINGDVRFPQEFPNALPDTIDRIQAKIDAITNVPDPDEKKDWERVKSLGEAALVGSASVIVIENAIKEVQGYISKWSVKKPKDNHLNEAEGLLKRLKDALAEALRRKYSSEWDEVNKFDYDAIIDYLKHHHNSPFLKEADEFLWDITHTTRPLKKSTFRRYISDAKLFGLSHSNEANDMLNKFDEWQRLKEDSNWRDVHDFIKYNPDSGFIEEAQELLDELVEKELDKMRQNPATYSAKDCYDLVSYDLVSKHSLIAENLISEDSYIKMNDVESFKENHPIPNPNGNFFEDSENEDITDIFLFGIPGTGKTSALMGLLHSVKFNFNSVRADGEYGEILQNYVENGYMAPQTLGNFVAICTGSVTDQKGVEHPVNIIDMAGEDFALKIAKHPDGVVAFPDMGHSAAELLDSKHRKLFFVVIDPTSDMVTLERPVYEYDDAGIPINILDYRYIPIYQNQTLNRLINLFDDPVNSSIMKRVDGIYFLMTKSDTLDPNGEGQDVKVANGLRKINNRRYKQQVEHVKKICGKSKLDLPEPRLFLFSLGTFYVGNVFEPDSTDADAILDMVAGNSVGVADDNIWDKFVSFLSKPIF